VTGEREVSRSGWRRWRWWVAGLLVLAMAAHAGWWYLPRVREGRPDPDDVPGRLLAAGKLPVALWVAYPHQNLGALEGAFGRGEDRQRFLEALARLADLPEPALPRFGPFAAPPARELVMLSDEAGERVLVAARVYPVLAAVARLAGRVAGNPWLAGGQVEAFGGRAQVRWDGTLWTVGNVPLEAALGGETARGDGRWPEGLAVLRLERPFSYLPAGTHSLCRTASGLEVITAGSAAGAAEAAATGLLARGPAAKPVLLVVSGPGGPLAGEGGALALFAGEPDGGGLSGLLRGLPAAVVWYRPGSDRFDLPGEDLLSRIGGRLRSSNGWSLLGSSPSTVAAAEPLTSVVDRLAATASVAVAVEPSAGLSSVDRVLAVLDAVPLVSRDDVARWRDWRTVLEPLTVYDSLTVLSLPPAPDAPRGSLRVVLARPEA